jgi:hypothetical protein
MGDRRDEVDLLMLSFVVISRPCETLSFEACEVDRELVFSRRDGKYSEYRGMRRRVSFMVQSRKISKS